MLKILPKNFPGKFLFLCFFVIFSSCQQHSSENTLRKWRNEDDKIKVLCTTEMIRDITSELGGDHVSILTLISHGIDPHIYELVKGDDEKFTQADIIFSNGLSLEHGPSLKYQLSSNPNNISLGNWILDNHPEKIIFHNKISDPHIWMDIELWKLTINPIKDALKIRKPELASFFESQADALQKKLQQLHDDTKALLNTIPEETRYLVTSHDAFYYFTKAYLATKDEQANGNWAIRCKAPEGLAPNGKVSLADIQNIIDHIAKYQVPVIFSESAVSQDSIRKIVTAANEMGIELNFSEIPLYSDSLGGPGSKVETYHQMVPYNAEIILNYLIKKDDK